MTNFSICRMCLAHNSRIYVITDTSLLEIYEKITDIKIPTMEEGALMSCYVCHYQLRKCQLFVDRTIKANEIIRQFLNSDLQLTEKTLGMIDKRSISPPLVISPTECMFLDGDFKIEETPIKHENVKIEVDIVEKESDETVDNTDFLEAPPDDQHSDSEDDVPLKAISVKNKAKTEKLRVKKKVNTEVKGTQNLKLNAKEIILTKEEQIQNMMERAKSLNYLNSPFKCDLCYKGFVDSKAFENHKEKHDESSGDFECEICHMRYRTARHVRTHAAAAHTRQYVCERCGHRSHTANQAREHEKWHNGFTYECQLCSQTFRKPTSYLTHMRKRHPTEHVCDICGDSFVGRHGLLMHKSKTHKKDELMEKRQETDTFCSECNIRFYTLDAWRRHIMTSIKHALGNEHSVSCLVCGLQMAGSTLRNHLTTEHTNEQTKSNKLKHPVDARLPCEQCGVNFVNRSKLQAHIKRVHLGLKYNKNIVCEVCGKRCTSNASLKYHQRTHTGERPYACDVCPKRFSDRNQLRIHARCHSGERPYACARCGRRFAQRPALSRHHRVHTGAKPYDCQYCSKTFSQSNSLKLHVNTVHLKLPNKKKAPQVTEQQDT